MTALTKRVATQCHTGDQPLKQLAEQLASVGEGIARTVAPTGNADVYADIKYRQNLMVYVFTCPAEKLDEKHEALVQLFAAGESYNRVETDGAGDLRLHIEVRIPHWGLSPVGILFGARA